MDWQLSSIHMYINFSQVLYSVIGTNNLQIAHKLRGDEMPLGRRLKPVEIESVLARENKSVPIYAQHNSDEIKINDTNISVNLFHAEKPQYSFSDVILNDRTYEAIQDVLTLYEKQELLFNKWGLSETHKKQKRAGINLYGPSGTGKSVTAHAIAAQLGRDILTVDYSQIESKYVGETSKNLTEMFDYAKKSEAIILFDEADALLSKRVNNMSSSTDVSVNQTRSVLLILINEFDDLILFASNFIANYDPAFMRRILAHIKFELPNEVNRFKLWHMYIPKIMPTNVNIKKLSAKYEGISGSDISNAVFHATLKAARLNRDVVEHVYFEEAIEKIISSRVDNEGIGNPILKRTVDEEYVKKQFGGELPR